MRQFFAHGDFAGAVEKIPYEIADMLHCMLAGLGISYRMAGKRKMETVIKASHVARVSSKYSLSATAHGDSSRAFLRKFAGARTIAALLALLILAPAPFLSAHDIP